MVFKRFDNIFRSFTFQGKKLLFDLMIFLVDREAIISLEIIDGNVRLITEVTSITAGWLKYNGKFPIKNLRIITWY